MFYHLYIFSGVKWKEKVDLMCCLPNRFPLPIFLLINKCDKMERVKRRPWVEKVQLDNYIRENQFYNNFFISAENIHDNRESCISNQSVDVESPLREMIKTLMQFPDIKEKLIEGNIIENKKQTNLQAAQANPNMNANNKSGSTKEKNSNNISTNSSYLNRSEDSLGANIRAAKGMKESKGADKNSKCSIL